MDTRTRTRPNTNPNGTVVQKPMPMLRAEVGMRVGMIQEGEGHWPYSSEYLKK